MSLANLFYQQHCWLLPVLLFLAPEGYVADEIITSAAGTRVRVGNTDAEGRMAMADSLHYMKEKVLVALLISLATDCTGSVG